jgi:hypothetical protein
MKMTSVNNDQVSAGIWLIVGAAITAASISIGLGTLSSPGTGFFPFLAGSAISFLSCLGLVYSTLQKKRGQGRKPTMANMRWKNSLIVVAAMLGYIFALKTLGFALSTALFVGFLLRAVQPQKWLVVIGWGIGTALACFVIFEVWLQAHLPKGLFGF